MPAWLAVHRTEISLGALDRQAVTDEDRHEQTYVSFRPGHAEVDGHDGGLHEIGVFALDMMESPGSVEAVAVFDGSLFA